MICNLGDPMSLRHHVGHFYVCALFNSTFSAIHWNTLQYISHFGGIKSLLCKYTFLLLVTFAHIYTSVLGHCHEYTQKWLTMTNTEKKSFWHTYAYVCVRICVCVWSICTCDLCMCLCVYVGVCLCIHAHTCIHSSWKKNDVYTQFMTKRMGAANWFT